MKKAIIIIMAFALGFSGYANAAADEIPAKSLAELLKLVQEGRVVNGEVNDRREREFIADKAKQQRELKNAKRMQREEEAEAERLEGIFEKNEQDIAAKQEILAKRLGSLRELFGVLQQVAGDTQGVFEGSIVSSQLPGRGEWLGEFAQSMGKSTKLATIAEIERLWFELQREMTESAKITRFNATVIKLDGEEVQQEVVRVGSFNLISDGQYVAYDINTGLIQELPRQPAARFVDSAADLESSSTGYTPFGLDPTRGQLLALQVQVPTI
ncbi:MAG: energy transducer TonB, partial [Gammaproteobacteria bacterium]|nr:energy transducer TonB [Gammaproteobacteria bacterium]